MWLSCILSVLWSSGLHHKKNNSCLNPCKIKSCRKVMGQYGENKQERKTVKVLKIMNLAYLCERMIFLGNKAMV